MNFRYAFFVATLLLSFTPLEARFVPDWNFDKLLSSSDMVAIVEPTKNENNSDQWEWVPAFAQGVTTTFKVISVLKGDVAKGSDIRLRHFVYTIAVPPNGGAMVNFELGPFNLDATFTQNGKAVPYRFENVHPTWLVYLKKAANGDFVPTSGQIDPSYSFLELHHAAMFDPTQGMVPK